MKKTRNLLALLSSFIFASALAQVRIVCTAALTEAHADFRKQQYCQSLNILKNLGYHDFYIVEALKKHGPTFLDEFTPNVFYATVNNPRLRNHGINEAKTLLEGCIHFQFDPEDIILKLTGRYTLLSDLFLRTVENNSDADAIIKVNEDGNVFTLGFAMRFKYLKEMYETIDYGPLDRGMIPIEYRVGDYVKKKVKEGNFKVVYVDKLDIKADIYGSSTAPGASGVSYH